MDLNILKRRLQCPQVPPKPEELPKIIKETKQIVYAIENREPPPPNSKVFKCPEDFDFDISKGPSVFVSELDLNDPVYDFRLTTKKGRDSRENFQNLLMQIF